MRRSERFLFSATVAAVVAAAASPASAGGDLFEAGAREYAIACAMCHGEKADGKGPYAELLKVGAPALTGIAAANGGAFPLLDVFTVIDGRKGLRGHGGEMPVWGDRYLHDGRSGPFEGYGAEMQARARILELVFYLQSIQTPPASAP